MEGELLEGYYPGLSEIPAKQLVVKIPAMSSDVNEIVLMQGETEEDAESAAAILQARIDAQAEGGAWYPESLEAWKAAKVLRGGNRYPRKQGQIRRQEVPVLEKAQEQKVEHHGGDLRGPDCLRGASGGFRGAVPPPIL